MSELSKRGYALDVYRAALGALPAPGAGCHGALLGVANKAARAGVGADQALDEIYAAVPRGRRRVTRKEVADAVAKAYGECVAGGAGAVAHRPRVNQARADTALADILGRGRGATEQDWWEASPVRLDGEPRNDWRVLLDHLYVDDDVLFVGDRYDGAVETVKRWRVLLEKRTAPYIIPNPLTGERARTKGGAVSYRADACVAAFRFAIVEFDEMPIDKQLEFWWGLRTAPVAALVHSGGKSVHAWLAVNAQNVAAWEREVEGRLFPLLVALGADSTCRNEARLSRLPGHERGIGQMQKLLYLNPLAGKAVSHE